MTLRLMNFDHESSYHDVFVAFLYQNFPFSVAYMSNSKDHTY